MVDDFAVEYSSRAVEWPIKNRGKEQYSVKSCAILKYLNGLGFKLVIFSAHHNFSLDDSNLFSAKSEHFIASGLCG